jgi:hypothetical protein
LAKPHQCGAAESREAAGEEAEQSVMARKSACIINPHPGEILMEEFLKPMALSQTALARAIGDKPKSIGPRAA